MAQQKKYFLIVILGLLFFFPGYVLADAPSSLDAGLVGHWTFDGKDMLTNARDSSGQGKNGSLVGYTSGTTTVPGKRGQALRFNGSSQYVRVGSVTTGQSITYSAWLNINAYNPSNGYFIWDDDSTAGGDTFMQVLSTGKVRINSAGFTALTSATTLSLNQWYNVTCVITPSGKSIYINGALDASHGISIGSRTGLSYVSFGEGFDGNTTFNHYFNGSIDDVRIYNRSLSAEEVKQLYSSSVSAVNTTVNIPNIDTGLIAHWTFDGKDMRSGVTDSSGLGNNGTLSGYTTASGTVPGRLGQALSFNGSNQYVSNTQTLTALVNSPASVTLSAWVKPNAAGGVVLNELGNGGWHDAQMEVETNNSIKVCMWVGSLGCATAASGITYGQWYHVVMTYDSANTILKGYVNAVFGGSLTNTKQYPGGTLGYDIGQTDSTNGGNGNYFSGVIDDVRIYSRALSAAEVKQLYLSGGAVVNQTVNVPTIDTGLVGHWTFDGKDMKPNARDSSGQGNHGSLLRYTSGTTTVSGKIGQALSFNGSNQVVDIGTSSTLNVSTNGTISAWLKPRTINTNQWIVGLGTNTGDMTFGLEYGRVTNKLGTIWGTGGGGYDILASTRDLTANVWQHVAVVRTGSGSSWSASLYINGVLDSTQAGTHAVSSFVNGYLGSYTGSGNQDTNGALDDVRIYNRALSAAEVKQVYQSGFSKLN